MPDKLYKPPHEEQPCGLPSPPRNQAVAGSCGQLVRLNRVQLFLQIGHKQRLASQMHLDKTMPRRFVAGEVVQRTTGLGGRFEVVAVRVKDDTWRYQIKSLVTSSLEWVDENEITLSIVH
jgi:hypothetical protein